MNYRIYAGDEPGALVTGTTFIFMMVLVAALNRYGTSANYTFREE